MERDARDGRCARVVWSRARENGERKRCPRVRAHESERYKRLCQEAPFDFFCSPWCDVELPTPRGLSLPSIRRGPHRRSPLLATCPHADRTAHDTAYGTVSLPRAAHRQTHTYHVHPARTATHTRTASPTHAKYRSGSCAPACSLLPAVCPIFSLSLPHVSLLACVFLITSTTIRNLSVLMCLSAWS